MKNMKKVTALLLVLAMMVATLVGCGEKKTPAESFFDLYDEMSALQNAESDVAMTMEMEGEGIEATSVNADLNVVSGNGGKIGVMTGTVGAMGVTITIPEIIITEEAMYLEGKATADLLTLVGMDADGSIAEMINSTYIVNSLTESGTAADTEKLLSLYQTTGAKVKEELMSREGIIVEDEANKGTYVLTIDGELFTELLRIIMDDVVANQDAYIEAFAAMYADDETIDEATLKDVFAELETLMTEWDTNEDLAEIKEMLTNVSMAISVSKDKDKNYQCDVTLDMTVEGVSVALDLNETAKALSEAPSIEVPTEYVQMEDVVNAAMGSYEDEYYDSDEYYEEEYYEEETGSVEDLALTEVNDQISEITFATYNGAFVTVPVLAEFNWDEAYIASDLTSVGVGNSDYSCYASYTSFTKDSFDLESYMTDYYSYYAEEDGTNSMTLSEVVSNDKASAMAIYDAFGDYEMYDLMLTVDCGDEYVVLSYTVYDSDTSRLDSIMEYFDLTLPQ